MFIKWDMFDEIRCGMSAKTLPSLDNNVRKIQTNGRLKFAGETSTGACSRGDSAVGLAVAPRHRGRVAVREVQVRGEVKPARLRGGRRALPNCSQKDFKFDE